MRIGPVRIGRGAVIGANAVVLTDVPAGAIATGILEIAAAVRLRKVITNEWWLALAGAASFGFGVLLLLRPGLGALALVWWIGAFALVFGVLLIALAFRMRSWGRTASTSPAAS